MLELHALISLFNTFFAEINNDKTFRDVPSYP